MPKGDISLVVFDLGGVLLRLNDVRESFGLDADDTDFLRIWLESPAVRMFECGEIEELEFAGKILAELQLPYDHHEFMRRFRAWPGGLFPGIPELLERIPQHTATAILSNTNPVHWHQGNIDDTLRSRIDHLSLSYETGLLKPDDESFTRVIEHFGCAPRETLFVDDNPLNIAAANRLGIRARLTRGYDELHDVLAECLPLTP